MSNTVKRTGSRKTGSQRLKPKGSGLARRLAISKKRGSARPKRKARAK